MFLVLIAMFGAGTCLAATSVDSGAVHYAWANVTRVNPIYQDVRIPDGTQKCYKQPTVQRGGGGGATATLLGTAIGGVLGNTVNAVDGAKATVGAVAGGAVADRGAHDNSSGTDGGVTHCAPTEGEHMERRIVGYDVEYRYRGESYVSRMNYDPGERLRVRVSVTPAD